MRNKIMGYSGEDRARQQQKTAQQVAAGTHSAMGTPWTLDGSRAFGKLDQIKSRGPGASMGRDMDASRANSAAETLRQPPPMPTSIPASGNSIAPKPVTNYSGVMPSYFGDQQGRTMGAVQPYQGRIGSSLHAPQQGAAESLLSSFGNESFNPAQDENNNGIIDPWEM